MGFGAVWPLAALEIPPFLVFRKPASCACGYPLVSITPCSGVQAFALTSTAARGYLGGLRVVHCGRVTKDRAMAQPRETIAVSELDEPTTLAQTVTQWQARWQPEVKGLEINRLIEAPTWTVLIIAYRSKAFLLDCIARVRDCRLPSGTTLEVLVADCGGLEALRPRLRDVADRVITLTPDIGLNPARNAAIAWAAGKYVALLDDDGEIEPDWIANAQRHLEDPAVVALRGKIVFKQHRYFTTLASHYDRGANVVDDTLAVEGNMAIRRSAYFAAGGFGERFYGGEGAQLTYALLQRFAGLRVIYAPDVVMRHDYFQSWQHFIKKSMMYGDIMNKLALQEPEAEAMLAWIRADWDKAKPRRTMRLDERLAWMSLCTLRAGLQTAARLQQAAPVNRANLSPRR